MAKNTKSKAKKVAPAKKAAPAKAAAPKESPKVLADRQLRKLEQDYNALGRYIHVPHQKLLELRKRWDAGERSKAFYQEIFASVTLPPN